MKRTLYPYYFDFQKSFGSKIKEPVSFMDDFFEVLRYICEMPNQERKEDYYKEKKILYLDSFELDKEENNIYIKFISARYATIRKVINTEDLSEQKEKQKEKRDGDEEKTHLTIKFVDKQHGYCLNEYNKDGAGFIKSITYLNEYIKKYHVLKNDNILYKIVANNVISKDFLLSLTEAKKINAVTLTVDKEEASISEFKNFSNNTDLSRDIDLVYKPLKKGKSILAKTIEEFYAEYKRNKTMIKKITVKAKNSSGRDLTFDTEQMKERYSVEVKETEAGEVDTNDMFNEMKQELKKYNQRE